MCWDRRPTTREIVRCVRINGKVLETRQKKSVCRSVRLLPPLFVLGRLFCFRFVSLLIVSRPIGWLVDRLVGWLVSSLPGMSGIARCACGCAPVVRTLFIPAFTRVRFPVHDGICALQSAGTVVRTAQTSTQTFLFNDYR